MNNIIDLAKEAGFSDHYLATVQLHELERFAALVRAEREWVDLTDDEIVEIIGDDIYVDDFHAVIAAFKEKNK